MLTYDDLRWLRDGTPPDVRRRFALMVAPAYRLQWVDRGLLINDDILVPCGLRDTFAVILAAIERPARRVDVGGLVRPLPAPERRASRVNERLSWAYAKVEAKCFPVASRMRQCIKSHGTVDSVEIVYCPGQGGPRLEVIR